MMRRVSTATLFAIAACVAGSACAPPKTVATPDAERVVVVQDDGAVRRVDSADEYSEFTVHATSDAVWRALVDTYVSLEILPTVNSPATGTFGNQGFVMPRTIAGHRSREYFDCGGTIGGSRIDTGRLTVTMVSSLTPADTSGIRVRTRITGIIRNNDGSSREPITCSSTGALERALRGGVESRVTGIVR